MSGKNYGTMFMGYYYDESRTKIGYDVWVEGEHSISFHNVAYHSKGQLIKQLIHSGYKVGEIQTRRVVLN